MATSLSSRSPWALPQFEDLEDLDSVFVLRVSPKFDLPDDTSVVNAEVQT